MRRSRRLKKLAYQLDAHLARLLKLARSEENNATPESRRLVSFVVLDTLSAWSTYCREYYLSCALLGPQTRSKAIVTHNAAAVIQDERSALIEAIRRTHKPWFNPDPGASISSRDEPDWKSKGVMLKLSSSLQFSNHLAITNAFSYRTTALSDFPAVRNFFAHKDKDAAARVGLLARMRYNTPAVSHPADLVNTILHARTDTLLAQWIADYRYLARALSA